MEKVIFAALPKKQFSSEIDEFWFIASYVGQVSGNFLQVTLYAPSQLFVEADSLRPF